MRLNLLKKLVERGDRRPESVDSEKSISLGGGHSFRDERKRKNSLYFAIASREIQFASSV